MPPYSQTLLQKPEGPLLYEEVAEKIYQAIEEGVLRPGDRVPSLRRMSKQHKVSISTVLQAYETLASKGYIEARAKSGYFVRHQTRLSEPEPSRPRPAATQVGIGEMVAMVFGATRRSNILRLGAACPSGQLLPTKKLHRVLVSLARSEGAQCIGYDMPPGCEPLRREVSRRSLEWGVHLPMDELITTCGSMEAINLCLRAVAKPGEIVAVESPTYFGVLQAIEGLGLQAVEIPTHPRDGMNLDALERALDTYDIAACICVPNFNNPLGSLMPDENKKRLVEMLGCRNVPLIEDDINGDLHFGPERPRVAKSFDKRDLVMLCSSFSKTLAPGYRVGWVAPGRFYKQVQIQKFSNTTATATLPQLAIAEFVRSGSYDTHLKTLRRMYAAQVHQMSQAIAECFPAETKITRPTGGFMLWVELPPQVDALKLHAHAMAENISVAPGPLFSAKQQHRNFIRISCGYPWSQKLADGVVTLGKLARRLS